MADTILLKKIPYTFKDPSLLDNRSFIGGKWINASDGKTFAVYDPEDNKEIAQVADLSVSDVQSAITAASETFKSFKSSPHRERRWLMRRWADLIRENKDDLGAICTLELGKPFTESLVTVKYGTDFLDWFEGEIERAYGETIPAARTNNRIHTVREPQGVVAAITPWNSPIAMVTRKVGAAIAAGNTVLCKPAPETPLCAIAVAKLFERAGGPPGVLNVITNSAARTPEVGAELCGNRLIKHLSFTGSTAVGKYLNTECSKTFKKTSMELGGNAPFIVFEDADFSKAVDGLITSKFRSSGQTCVCANRIFVHSSIITRFASALQTRLGETFHYGSVWDPKVNFGPLYSPRAFEKLNRQSQDAVAHGASIAGDDVAKAQETYGPNFYPPTVVTLGKEGGGGGGKEKLKEMTFMREETFGPLAFLVPFDTEEEVIALANDTDAGLAAYFYTEDIGRMYRVSEALETGMVGVRVGLISACEQPFGGVKESGTGREGGRGALEEYLNVKSVTVGI